MWCGTGAHGDGVDAYVVGVGRVGDMYIGGRGAARVLNG